MTQHSRPDTTRRAALTGLGLAGLAATLTACGGPAASDSSGGSSGGGSGTTGSTAGGTAGDTALGPASDVPVGGGKVFTSAQVVVTQPSAGQYKAFTAVCTHAQCFVDQVANGTIDCPCHGSRFSVKDGSVVIGPASSPLPSKPISVSSGQITVGRG